MNTAKTEDNLIGAFYPRLGDEGSMPDLDGAISWLNSGSRELRAGQEKLENVRRFLVNLGNHLVSSRLQERAFGANEGAVSLTS
jgi:hypothetical protein